jgi:SAM-dependent methyltransferase|tara:strand:+ start:703 stop:1422 length:720 start_codon:yes stop_codon:yes gene_type:complete
MKNIGLKNPYSKFKHTEEINKTDLSKNDIEGLPEYLKENPGHKVLNVGSGNTNLIDNRVVHLDIFVYEVIDLIADASSLPFANNSFDAIFCNAVLEHTKNPFQVVDEFTRVLKDEGYVSIGIPFLFPFHDVPDHYFNVSTSGIKSLFKAYEPIDTGVSLGPWYALQNIIGNYKKMLKRVYKDGNTGVFEKIRVFCIYRLLSWGMKFNHKTIALTEEEQNVLAGAVFFKGKKSIKNIKGG